jgi:polyisoprenyl-teichoic acid--peptidoglycan teichoic acid transferase
MTTGSGLPRVALPEAGDGSRRRDRPPPRRRRRLPGGRTLLAVIALVVAVAAIVAVVVAMTGSLGGGGSSATPPTTAPPGRLAGETLLLLQRDGGGTLSSATLLVVGPSGTGGDLVYVPPGTLVEVPSLGLVSLRDAGRDGGPDLVRQALENVLGQAVDAMAVLGPAELTAAVEPAGVLTVELATPVEVQGADGRVEVLFGGGEIAVAPDEVPRLLETPGTTDLDRLVRHQAFWEGWLTQVSVGGEVPDDEALGPIVDALAGGERTHRLLPVQAVAAEGDLYQVDREQLAVLVAEVLPDATPVGERIRVQVLNGTGTPGLAQQVAPLLVPAGATVTLTNNADRFDYEVTQVVFYTDEGEGAARRVRDALGVGEVVRSRTPLGVVDVTVVVGADFLSRAPGTPAEGDDETAGA